MPVSKQEVWNALAALDVAGMPAKHAPPMRLVGGPGSYILRIDGHGVVAWLCQANGKLLEPNSPSEKQAIAVAQALVMAWNLLPDLLEAVQVLTAEKEALMLVGPDQSE